ncbi:MAG: MFS transporter [Candidatus Thermoplasmatota archaeon]|nr:MFS transporter [Candidatus Thermoplasmatota archaeon]
MPDAPPSGKSGKKSIFSFGFNIILLGIVSFFMDVSGEMIAPLLPIFVTGLGGTAAMVGLIEGVADGTASLMKVFSGYWSDKIGRRKIFVNVGYGLSAVSRVFLPFATSWTHVLGVRFSERVGKGIRNSPRDAIIASSADKDIRGRAFGFHRAMDTAGAVVGPLIVVALILAFKVSDFKTIFMIAIVPAFIAMILTFFVKEKKNGTMRKFLLAKPNRDFIWILVIGGLFSFGNVSYAFFILKASQALGLGSTKFLTQAGAVQVIVPILLIYVFFNLIYALCAMPAGSLSDKIGRRPTIIMGYLIFSLCAIGFAFVESVPQSLALPMLIGIFALYGLSQAVNEVIPNALVADISDPENRATTIGAYNMIVAIVNIPSDLAAGLIWIYGGNWGMKPGMLTFLICAGIGIASAVLFQIFVNGKKKTVGA